MVSSMRLSACLVSSLCQIWKGWCGSFGGWSNRVVSWRLQHGESATLLRSMPSGEKRYRRKDQTCIQPSILGIASLCRSSLTNSCVIAACPTQRSFPKVEARYYEHRKIGGPLYLLKVCA